MKLKPEQRNEAITAVIVNAMMHYNRWQMYGDNRSIPPEVSKRAYTQDKKLRAMADAAVVAVIALMREGD